MSVQTDIRLVDNVFVKMMHLYFSGDHVHSHTHTFDHITLLSKGSVVMKAKDKETTYVAPILIVTPKETMHEFVALENDCVLCCIHAIRDGDDVDDIAPQNITEAEAEALIEQFPLVELNSSLEFTNSVMSKA